ncbi:hypothetical protein [Neopusillimonas aromaticivorans]|uniref:hypothetical protein n=1 Tax=Neopusillimonas aromaticivorans TaxID=2979868 RepID=UPI002595C777|nr:hypothetical protein [Neopusillimonas aromaticivorans]WJJ94099.1 hypothetical protein N7E01_02780 [Neopusillimonas aromaticivorans]
MMLILGNFWGVNPFVAVVIGGLAAGLIALPVSRIAFRLQGGYFAIGTWVIAEVFRLTFANIPAVGGGSGTTLTALRGINRATRESVTYWMALACVVAAIALVYFFCAASRDWPCWQYAITKQRQSPRGSMSAKSNWRSMP